MNDADLRKEIIIEVRKGHEHELYKEQNILDRRMLMYPAYRAALEALGGIIASTNEWYVNQHDSRCKRKDMALYGYANNIIAFCGNRGQGKTSAMLSFTSALGFRSHGYMMDRWNNDYERELNAYTRGRKFFILPPIDPTMLKEQGNVIGLVLANLLTEIEERWEFPKKSTPAPHGGKPLEAKKYEILRTFQNCLVGLSMERREAAERKMDFDNFAQSNDVFALKNNIHDIILHLFELLDWERKESFLVVQLDDTDMHMDRAYETVEFIRKYLCIPNVVVVMATELSQLRSLVNLHYREKMSYDPKTKVSFDFDYISAKYIDKLIPVPQTIHLPTLKSQRDLGKKLKLVVKEDKKDQKDDVEGTAGEENKDGGADDNDIQRAIFKLIYDKTGLVFIRHDSYMHEIMPSSLRGYMHLHRLLSGMPEPIKASIPENAPIDISLCKKRLKRITQKLHNLSRFEDYFLNEWVPSRILEEEDRQKILSLKDVSPGRLSQYIIQHTLASPECKPCAGAKKILKIMEDCCSQKKAAAESATENPGEAASGSRTDEEDSKSSAKDLSYAAYLNELSDYLKHKCLTSEQYNFVFAVGTYVSIQLHKGSMIDEIETMQAWLQKGSAGNMIEFKQLKRMVTSDEPVKAGVPRIKEAIADTSNFDKGKLAQGCLELLELDCIVQKLELSASNRLRFQIGLIYYFCNWDVFYQLYDNVHEYETDENPIDKFIQEFGVELDKTKGPVGSRPTILNYLKPILTLSQEYPQSCEARKKKKAGTRTSAKKPKPSGEPETP